MKKYTDEALAKGTEIEMEHAETIHKYMKEGTDIKEVAQSIARDHLEESPTYYDELEQMESKFAKGGLLSHENARLFYVLKNDYVGFIQSLTTHEQEIITPEGNVSSYLGVFLKMSDAFDGFFEYIKDENGQYLIEENPKSKFSIEQIYYDGTSVDKYGDAILKQKVLFSLTGNQIKESVDLNRFKEGGEIPTHDFKNLEEWYTEEADLKIYKTAKDYFEKNVTDDYWHFSTLYMSPTEVTYEIYSEKGGYYLYIKHDGGKNISKPILKKMDDTMAKGGDTSERNNNFQENFEQIMKDEGYYLTFYDADLNDTPKEKALEMSVVRLEPYYEQKSMKLPKKQEITVEWVMNKMSQEAIYRDFSEKFNEVLKKMGYGSSNIYPTTYGIGVFVFFRSINASKDKIKEILDENNIQYVEELSDAHLVVRFKISKSKENIERINAFLNKNMDTFESGGDTSQSIIENNKLIAEFMGAKFKGNSLPAISSRLNENELWLPFHGIVRYDSVEVDAGQVLKYHKSWDWLMPVVEKIAYSEYVFTFNIEIDLKIENQVEIVNGLRDYQFVIRNKSKNNQVNTFGLIYKSVIQFIEWYNENKDEQEFRNGGQTDAQQKKIATVMREFKEGELTSHGKEVTNPKQAIAIALSEAGVERKEEGGNVKSDNVYAVNSATGHIALNLESHHYNEDTDTELVPVSELIKMREFDRTIEPKFNAEDSNRNIKFLKQKFIEEGIQEPLMIEYSKEQKAVLLTEGNHRLNSAIELGIEYLPARVVVNKYSKFKGKHAKKMLPVIGFPIKEDGYIPSNLRPSQVGIEGTKPIRFEEGGIIEGQLHSECNEDHGCGRKFEVGDGGRIIEAERDEAVIVSKAFEDENEYTIKGTPSEIASAVNVLGDGKSFDAGAEVQTVDGEPIEIPELEIEAPDTDVEDVIESGSVIINRKSMADETEYEVTGTPKQIASAINSIDGNGVVIEEGAEIEKTED